ncbi:TMhelix containing protein [Vibrio phage 2.275.O._10N.286.54.E11]|nr:TMhelix containing protein [Vibrio phage 2.275.O._10N.286.54.E11]
MRLITKAIILCSIAILSILWNIAAQATEDDKKKHLVASAVIGTATQMYTEDWKTSMTVCTSIGVAKELIDSVGPGTADAKDIAYDIAGCAIGVIVGDTAVKVYHLDSGAGIQYTIKF